MWYCFRGVDAYDPIQQHEDDDDDVVSFTHRRKRSASSSALLLTVVVVVSCLGVFAMMALSGRRETLESERTGLEEADVLGRSQGFACDDFDDDAVYTNTSCALQDVSACDFYCSSGWCAELCGESCERGEGAVCAVSYLNTIWKTCANVPFKQDANVSVATYGNGSLDSDEAFGCDRHVYCRFCDETCRHVLATFASGAYVGPISVGPHSMLLLNNLTEICSQLDDFRHDLPSRF